MPEHPNEPLLEAILVNQDKNAKEVINTLELMLEHADTNKLDPILEAQLILTHDSTKEIVQAIKDIPKTEIPESKEVDLNETNKLLRELTDEVKKKEDYEVEIDSNLREKLKGEKGDKGEDGKDGVNGKDGKNGLNGLNGRDGKDGIQGPQGIPGKSLTQEDVDRIAKGLSKTKKENFLFANSGVNSVIAGSNITIDNSNPQHPIISSTGGGGGGGSGDVVGPASAVNNNFAAFDLTTGKLIKDSGSNASSFATSTQGTKADNAVVANTAITGATKTKITYDAKGLVTAGADATTADIADSLNKRYVTDANLTTIGNQSGTNTGDQVISDATLSTSDITTNDFTTAKHGFVPKGTNVGNYLKDDGTWSAIAGGGDMVLASTQTVSGLKTFLAGMFGLRNVANTFTSFFTNTNTVSRTYTLKDADGTLAFTSDITGINSGTNTGDQTSIVGITGTKAQFNTAVTDGDIMYVGDAPTTHTHVIADVTGLQTALDNKLDDTQFVGLSKITVDLTAPATPATGDLWVDTN